MPLKSFGPSWLKPTANPDGMDSSQLERVQEIWRGLMAQNSKKPASVSVPAGDDNMDVEIPGQFQKGPNVIARPGLAKDVESTFKIYPRLRGIVSSIQDVPGETVANEFNMTRFTPDQMGITNLMGITDTRNNGITINPSISGGKRGQTLLHELTHAAGSMNEILPQYVESQMPGYESMSRAKPLPPDAARLLLSMMKNGR